MGAIAGIVFFGASRGHASRLRPMLQAMRRRGPDDEGYAVFRDGGAPPALFGGRATLEEAYQLKLPYSPQRSIDEESGLSGVTLALGQRRLAIVDTSARGHQPMCSRGGRYWIVSDGTVLNYREVREELKPEGYTFETGTDTEVILAAFDRWGAASLNKLNGGFAFAIWHLEKRRLFCARDRLGMKPLFYHQAGEFFVFASLPEGLLASGLVPAEVNPDGLYHGMVLQMAPRPMTAFKGIQMLRPAHFMWVDAKGTCAERIYWSMPFGVTDHARSEESYAEELEALLQNATRKALVADMPLGTYMSGGIDSTTISVLASKERPGLKAFTLAHEAGDGIGEVQNARATAALHGIDLVVGDSRDGYRIAWDPDIVRGHEEPWMSLHAAFLLTPLAAAHGMKVMVGGTGADQLFLGFRLEERLKYWRLLRRLQPLPSTLPPWPEVARKATRWAGFPTLAHVYVFRLNSLVGTLLPEERVGILTPEFLSQIEALDTGQVLIDQLGFSESRFEDEAQALCFLDVSNYLSNRLLRDLDQEGAYAGIEGRTAFGDRDLLEFLARLPSEMKNRDGARKYLLRKVAREHIHPQCLDQHKMGFTSPLADWLTGPLEELADAKLDAVACLGIFRRAAIEDTRRMLHGRRIDWSEAYHIWQVVSTQLWHEAFFGGLGGRS